MDRGTAIHKLGEDFINGVTKKLPTEYTAFSKKMKRLKADGAKAEVDYAVTRKFDACSWDDWGSVWCRGKVDIENLYNAGLNNMWMLHIIDIKTGKSYPDHLIQNDLYALLGFCKYPRVKEISVENMYTDVGEVENEKNYTRKENFVELKMWWKKEADKIEGAKKFVETPGRHCSWCGYSKQKGGPCRY